MSYYLILQSEIYKNNCRLFILPVKLNILIHEHFIKLSYFLLKLIRK